MTDNYNGYPTNISGPEVPNNAPPHPHEENKTRRRDFLIGLSLGGAALAVGAGLSAALFGHNRSSSASSETPSPSESPSSSSEATSSATATETPPPTQEPVEPGTPSSERPEPRRSYNFANLSEFDSEKWKTMGDYDKGLACKTFFGNNLDDPNIMKILTESGANQAKELAITWFDHVDRLLRDLCDDAQSKALFTNAEGREVEVWPVLRCLADYIDVPHSNIVRGSNDENKDDSDKNKFKPHGYYGRLVEAAYEAHTKDKKPEKEDRIALHVTKCAIMAEYEDPFPINDGKETNQPQVYSAAYCEVQEIGDENGESYRVALETQRQITEKDRNTNHYTVHSFPRVPYFYPTNENDYKARAIKPRVTAPLNDIKEG
jgi:hypothetical protein